jgi:hypothetical protein
MALYGTRQIPMPLSLDRLLDYKAAMQLSSSDEPLNLTATMNLTYAALLTLLEFISPDPGTSLLYPSLAYSGLSSFSLFYYRIAPSLKILIAEYLLGGFNSMASNSWVLVFNFTLSNETSPTAIPVSFLPTGNIDTTVTTEAELSVIEAILAPSLNFLKQAALHRGIEVDFWKLVNFVFVGYHWLLLANLGQTSPTLYAPILFPPVPEWYRINFTEVASYSSVNNIFTNATLFTNYTNYLGDTILPLLNYPSPKFAPLADGNVLQAAETTFIMSYYCQVRKLKAPIVAMFSVVTTVVVFIRGPYAIVIWVAGYFQKRKTGGNQSIYFSDVRQRLRDL